MAGITRTGFTAQYDHVAVIAHGAHPEYRVEFDAPVAVSITGGTLANPPTLINQGSVVHVNAEGNYEVGCGAGTGTNYPVPCISLKNVVDPDVTTGKVGYTEVISGGSAVMLPDYRKSTYSAVGGVITAIPCTAGYEIETTEYVSGEYVPGDALVPATGDNVGKVTKAATAIFTSGGAVATTPVLGFVSKRPLTGGVDEAALSAINRSTLPSYDYNRLSFFTNFIPAAH